MYGFSYLIELSRSSYVCSSLKFEIEVELGFSEMITKYFRVEIGPTTEQCIDFAIALVVTIIVQSTRNFTWRMNLRQARSLPEKEPIVRKKLKIFLMVQLLYSSKVKTNRHEIWHAVQF